jgi:MinD-like ATPase involved in chromosome partitioning or flagellar assembly
VPSASGELIAVGGLCGGAGASTLAYLLARHAARSAPGPVLVCDTGGTSCGLATYAGVESPRSLPGIANAIAASDSLADGLFADGGPGLRVIASRPRIDSGVEPTALARVLEDARDAHVLTVVDCGTLSTATAVQALEASSHVVWVVPASANGVRHGSKLLALFGIEATRGETLVARRDPSGREPPMKRLASLAATRNAPLVLMPDLPDLGERPLADALEPAELGLDAILTAARRDRARACLT